MAITRIGSGAYTERPYGSFLGKAQIQPGVFAATLSLLPLFGLEVALLPLLDGSPSLQPLFDGDVVLLPGGTA